MNSKPKIAKDVFTACLTAAESGDIDAMFYIGYCYYYGEGTRANRKTAVKWWREAAEHGHTEAQKSLGDCYESGIGVSADNEIALKWYRMSAEAGNEHAQMLIVRYFLFFKERPISSLITREEAETYCRKAAALGNCLAKMYLRTIIKKTDIE